MFRKRISAAEFSRREIVFVLLTIAVSIGANRLSTTSAIFHKTFKGQRLSNRVISEKIVSSLIECVHLCLSQGCQSVNFGRDEKSVGLYTCQLNNSTAEDCVMLMDGTFDHYQMIDKVSLWDAKQSCQGPPFSVLFPRHSVLDYVELDDPGLPELSALTVCSWVKFARNAIGTIVTYATDAGSTNEFAIWCYTDKIIISIRNVWKDATSFPDDGLWHSMCVTWSNIGGNLTVYRDNVITDEFSGVEIGNNIAGGGRWVLGQDQDSVGGGFELVDALQGELAEVNIWGSVLTKQEIFSFSTNCERRMNGDVRCWPEFKTGLKGNAQVMEQTSCKN